MEDPNIRTKVVHSKTKPAYNVVGCDLGHKYKIARIPYIVLEQSEELTDKNRDEALLHANFISKCFNNSTMIAKLI